jgi:hypothetical protein
MGCLWDIANGPRRPAYSLEEFSQVSIAGAKVSEAWKKKVSEAWKKIQRPRDVQLLYG